MSSANPAAPAPWPAAGENYQRLLKAIHTHLKPKTYLEIGTELGLTLSLAECASLAVDPSFRVTRDIILAKPALHLYQMTSDAFFRSFDPQAILGDRIDFAFLDGLHLYEFLLRDFINTEKHCRRNSLVALHDCVPGDIPMARRLQDGPEKELSAHPQAWTGDVWKLVPILKKYRPDLSIIVADAAPTGLVLITNLDPTSRVLEESYAAIIREMADVDLASYGFGRFVEECSLVPSGSLLSFDGLAKRFWF
ncbi:MAG TPA: class I SAM-dependent methyltransferase [Microvirga sp.]|nr:class I SAM-dependent methyltransferase [Microvirga sp.]